MRESLSEHSGLFLTAMMNIYKNGINIEMIIITKKQLSFWKKIILNRHNNNSIKRAIKGYRLIVSSQMVYYSNFTPTLFSYISEHS